VFISYASADLGLAEKLFADLDDHGVKPWMDRHRLEAGVGWAKSIDEALEASDNLLLIATPDSKKSTFVENELSSAHKLKLRITPLLFKEFVGAWTFADGPQRIDFLNDPYEVAFAKLLKIKPAPFRRWRRFLIFLRRSQPLRLVLAVLTAAGGYWYFLWPSDVTFTVAGADPSKIEVRVHNTGWQRSTLDAGSFKLLFGTLPIEPQDLVMRQPGMDIPRHGEARIELTPTNLLTPKPRDERFYHTLDDVRQQIPGAKVHLVVNVTDSEDQSHAHSAELPATRIEPLIVDKFPPVPAEVH